MMNRIADKRHIMVRVDEKQVENPEFATLFFNCSLDFSPGQFIMLWIPGVDEKPYTLSYHSQKRFGITIEAKGKFSKKAVSLEKGDIVGIRGPFGKGFEIQSTGSCAVVAGGCGMAPLATLVEKLDKNICFINGAKSGNYILYPDRFDTKRLICTDDGSLGHKGLVTDLLVEQFEQGRKFDMIYTCGPEVMMYNVFRLCEQYGVSCQVSLERYMRCGFGVCGACICGSRLVCMDGPVFGSDRLRSMKDFNVKAFLKSGQEVDLPQYFAWRSL
jgi:dihydroorotate dehydrogenase electron transfer subunit